MIWYDGIISSELEFIRLQTREIVRRGHNEVLITFGFRTCVSQLLEMASTLLIEVVSYI